jgi:membrane-bound lytic murein transglycosylase B
MRMTRRVVSLALAAWAVPLAAPRAAGFRIEPNAGFDRWLRAFRMRAEEDGITAATLDRAFAGAGYMPKVIELDQRQAEVTKTLGDYLANAASKHRLENGLAKLRKHADLFARLEDLFGVEKHLLTAIWGMESSYGALPGDTPIIPALATMAYEGRRAEMFETELMGALRIVQRGDATPDMLKGSWAGAMGHMQTTPTVYERFGADFDGDGRIDIWSDKPDDALATAAAYLAWAGWTHGQPAWIEVRLPDRLDLALTGRVEPRLPSLWAGLGVRDMDGKPVPDHGPANVILPAGPEGPAMMIFDNFQVIKAYNYSDAYASGIWYIASRLTGGPRVRATFDKDPWGMSRDERKELQRRLNEAGFEAGQVDGVLGEKSRAAIRAYEEAEGLRVTGVPTRALLARLR